MDPGDRLFPNKKVLIPLEFFKENQKELRAEGGKWMKKTASSCSVVGALIVTIMFAIALIVSGGNDENSGYPLNPYVTLQKKTFFTPTIMIMLQYNSSRLWVTLPVIVLAGVPIIFFVLLQFPLLVEVTFSTYGQGIFKKVEKWP
ncbi:uncharacterized protein LOC114717892 [Neltuma alba]|uniref:uncharacterized protein LOC114717892 n=1 Tax=Neltuma alba TaxID=207710 RepID=UPI0010A52C29|nr:uncharacterized protein LOC114717892 [Prosopis alba]